MANNDTLEAFEGLEDNNSAEISNLKKRLESLKQMKDQTEDVIVSPPDVQRDDLNNLNKSEDISQEELQIFENRITALKKKLSEMEATNTTNNSDNTELKLIISETDKRDNAVNETDSKNINEYIDRNNKAMNNPTKELKHIQKARIQINSNDLSESVSALNSALDELLRLFCDVGAGMPDDYDDQLFIKLDAIIEQNNCIINQNDKIIYALTAVPGMENIVQKEVSEGKSSFDIIKKSITEKNNIDIERLPLAQNLNELSESSGRKKVSHKEIRDIFGTEKKENITNVDKNIRRDNLDSKDNSAELSYRHGSIPKPNISYDFDNDLSDTNAKPLKMNTAPKPPNFFDDERKKASRRV
jgi:hypothetical protein